MTEPAILVENLKKEFRIRHLGGGKKFTYGTLAETLSDGMTNLFRRVRGLEPLNQVRWEQFTALDDVSFDVEEGEVIGMVGRNGAGKSTALKILSRIMEPTGGRIVLNGRVASLLEVGTGFHPELTGRENIYMNGAVLGMSRREIAGKFDEIVEFAGVDRFLDTPVKRYSSGMTVRLAFAVAAHLEPEILLVDEVLAVGDAAFQKKCLGKMGDVASSEGRTIIFVSHSMPAIQRLCTKGLFLEQGQVAYFGEVEEAVRRYLSTGASGGEQGDDLLAGLKEHEVPDSAIKRCMILNADGLPCPELRLGEPFSIYVEIQARRDFADLALTLSIDTANQIRVVTLKNHDIGYPLKVNAGETKGFRIQVENVSMSPGVYSVSCVLREGRRAAHRVPQAASIEVSQLQYSDDHVYSHSAGLIKVWPRWEEATLEPAATVSGPE